jgi:Protein of unknown function (DUF2730)
MTPADTSLQTLVVWAAALSTLLSFGILIWTIFSGPSKRNASKLDAHSARLDDHELRLSGVEQSQRSLPTGNDMHQLELAIEQLKGELKSYRAIMERVEAIVSRHESHLLDGSKR